MENSLISRLNGLNNEKNEIKHKNMEEKEIIASIINGRENPLFKNMVFTVKHDGGEPSKRVSDIFEEHPQTLAVEILASNDAESVMACAKFLSDSNKYKVIIHGPSVYDEEEPMVSIFVFQKEIFTKQYVNYMKAISVYNCLQELAKNDTYGTDASIHGVDDFSKIRIVCKDLEAIIPSSYKIYPIDDETLRAFREIYTLIDTTIEKTEFLMRSIRSLYKKMEKGISVDFGPEVYANIVTDLMDSDEKFDCLKYKRVLLPGEVLKENVSINTFVSLLNAYCAGHLLSKGFEILYEIGCVQSILFNE